jgi:hypothetical protein
MVLIYLIYTSRLISGHSSTPVVSEPTCVHYQCYLKRTHRYRVSTDGLSVHKTEDNFLFNRYIVPEDGLTTLTECTVSPHKPLPHLQGILVLCYYSIPNIDHFGLTSMYLFMPGVRVHVFVHVHVHIHVHVRVIVCAHACTRPMFMCPCPCSIFMQHWDVDIQSGHEHAVWK